MVFHLHWTLTFWPPNNGIIRSELAGYLPASGSGFFVSGTRFPAVCCWDQVEHTLYRLNVQFVHSGTLAGISCSLEQVPYTRTIWSLLQYRSQITPPWELFSQYLSEIFSSYIKSTALLANFHALFPSLWVNALCVTRINLCFICNYHKARK